MSDSIRLVIATPCFGGQVSSLYLASMLKLQSHLRGYANIRMKLELDDGDALITRSRANLVARFLDDPEATHLLFIDADIGFEPDQVIRLLVYNADVSAAVYPIKRIDWDKVRRTIDARRPNPAAASLHYVLEVEDPANMVPQDGFIKGRYAGTGFLMVRRSVLEAMCERYKALKFRSDHCYADPLRESPNRFALFDCLIDERTGAYLSEDFSFCKRWADMGGEIWLDLQSRLNHVGPTTFYGDLASQFASDAGHPDHELHRHIQAEP
jgi:hypothetical protein